MGYLAHVVIGFAHLQIPGGIQHNTCRNKVTKELRVLTVEDVSVPQSIGDIYLQAFAGFKVPG